MPGPGTATGSASLQKLDSLSFTLHKLIQSLYIVNKMALAGKICLVTGASRGIGKGVALQLGKAGATVYITGRSSSKVTSKVGGTLKDTADEIDNSGGKAIPVVCDHGNDDQIKELFEKIQSDFGRIDILINNAYSAVNFILDETAAKRKFWEHEGGPEHSWDIINRVGLRNHYICSAYAAQMMVKRGSGLIINISSPGGLRYLFNVSYGVGKAAIDRMSADMAVELKSKNVVSICLWPGAVLTESIISEMEEAKAKGQTERLAGLEKTFGQGETIEYAGMAAVALAKDPNVMSKTGRVLIAADLGHEYGFKDIGGLTRSSFRQVNYWARAKGWTTLASCIPDFVKIPGSVLTAMTSKI